MTWERFEFWFLVAFAVVAFLAAGTLDYEEAKKRERAAQAVEHVR